MPLREIHRRLTAFTRELTQDTNSILSHRFTKAKKRVARTSTQSSLNSAVSSPTYNQHATKADKSATKEEETSGEE